MLRKKEIVTAVGTLAVAAGIGFAMQSSEAAKERYGAKARPVASYAGIQTINLDREESAAIFLEVEEIELTSASDAGVAPVPGREVSVRRGPAPFASDLPDLDRDVLPNTDDTVFDCQMQTEATPLPGAMVAVKMSAPCAVNERVTVHHSGMKFTATTDAEGTLNVQIPALAEQAVFVLAFSNGDGAVVQTQVDDFKNYDRVAVQWRGKAGFQLHAREFGADYGTAGHIWSGAASDVSRLVNGDSGFNVRLGDATVSDALMAEVYSISSSHAAQDGAVNLSVEAEVTANNCGREIAAKSIEVTDDGHLKTRDLVLEVPDCSAIGNFLVLNNLVSDLKVASN